MFSQLFNSAKRILNPALPDQEEPTDTPKTTFRRKTSITMVVTRGGAGMDTPRSEAATPRSSSRKRVGKRELEGLDTPTASAAKRQKKVAPRKKEIEETPEPDAPTPELIEESSDTIDAAVSEQAEVGSPETGKLPIRRRAGSPRVVVAHKPSPPVEDDDAAADEEATPTQDNDFHTPEGQASSVYATPATRRKQEASPTPKAKSSQDQTPATAKKNGRKTKAQKADESTPRALKFTTEIPSSTQESEPAPIASQDASLLKKAHVRFGSEEPAVDNALLQALQPTSGQSVTNIDQANDNDDGDDDNASDSDEAPEVVTTASAASKLKLAEADAARARARALQVQQEKERFKRSARDQRLATERAEKLLREAKKAQKLAKQAAKQVPPPTSHQQQHHPIDPRNLPALLPDTLLSAIDATRPPTPPPERHGKTEEQLRTEKLNHHIKFLERSTKPTKDVKRGKLNVAVLASLNKVLPPKANRDTRNVREHWLKGRGVEERKKTKGTFQHKRVERRVHGGRGFLRGEE